MRPPFRLLRVSEGVSHDTIECLRELLAQAEAGEVVGVAYAAMHKRRHYTINACGEAHRNPTFSRGMLRALDDELGAQTRA